jgi:hypothetical protein
VRSALEIWELFEMTLSWLSIIRLGLVQMCLGAVVVLMTSTLNRLMVVELSLAATLPGALVNTLLGSSFATQMGLHL